jgi:excisionase family DNA binding protein
MTAKADDAPQPIPRAYRINDFCKAFGVCRATAYNLIAAGDLPSVRIRGRRLIPADAAEALLASGQVAAVVGKK